MGVLPPKGVLDLEFETVIVLPENTLNYGNYR